MQPRYAEDRTLTVAGLNRAVRFGLEREWNDVWVVGEIADAMQASSGHVYFTLCDERESAQIRVVMFKSDVRRTKTVLETGARVRVRGGLTLYEARGTFQMIARTAQPAGDGNLAAQFQKLLRKLEEEGLLSPERKRPLPLLPRCIGVVTSEQGAAIHDIIRVASERCPVRIVVAPCAVQGPEAAASIVRAIELVQRLPELDVIIVARGGGSAEDLWAFNDEQVARAIARARVPVVSGVGHEVDTTIADLVADVRAATPSNAAELVVPKREVLDEQLSTLLRRVERAMDSRIDRERLVLSRAGNKLRDPRRALSSAQRALELHRRALHGALETRLVTEHARLDALTRKLPGLDPRARLSSQRDALQRLSIRLSLSPSRWLAPRAHKLRSFATRNQGLGGTLVDGARGELGPLIARLEALSPLSVLSRGYAIALSERTGKALRSTGDAERGDKLKLRLSDGELKVRVEE